MCKDEPYALHVNGELDDVDGITPQSLYEAYQKAVSEDQLDIYVVGDVDEQQVDSYISKYFEANERELRPVPELEQTRTREPQEVIEDADVKQGKLNMGFRTGTHFTDDDYPALQLFNGLFGGFSHSKLFINVREKASLAYYAASRIESFKGLLMVMSGIEVGNYQKAVDIIKEQFQEMKKAALQKRQSTRRKPSLKTRFLKRLIHRTV